jgi:hypothetical protein
MSVKKLQQERARTAQYRFYAFSGVKTGAYRIVVCDGEADPKAIAKFKDSKDAEMFLEARRNLYISTGE